MGYKIADRSIEKISVPVVCRIADQKFEFEKRCRMRKKQSLKRRTYLQIFLWKIIRLLFIWKKMHLEKCQGIHLMKNGYSSIKKSSEKSLAFLIVDFTSHR